MVVLPFLRCLLGGIVPKDHFNSANVSFQGPLECGPGVPYIFLPRLPCRVPGVALKSKWRVEPRTQGFDLARPRRPIRDGFTEIDDGCLRAPGRRVVLVWVFVPVAHGPESGLQDPIPGARTV